MFRVWGLGLIGFEGILIGPGQSRITWKSKWNMQGGGHVGKYSGLAGFLYPQVPTVLEVTRFA